MKIHWGLVVSLLNLARLNKPRFFFVPMLGLGPMKSMNPVSTEHVFSDLDLEYEYPEELTATHPAESPRVLLNSGSQNQEIQLPELLQQFQNGDLLVLNDTRVLKRRIFSGRREILFIKEVVSQVWEVLFPVRGMKLGGGLELPEGVTMTLIQKSIPQIVRVSSALDEAYFERHGEIPLPPYIQKVRDQRHTQVEDEFWYQTVWAKNQGSLAAPTASLHFKQKHLDVLRQRGVKIQKITLHVGLGTFLPIQGPIETHKMHQEQVLIPQEVWQEILKTKSDGKKIWALGTTVTRSLESVFQNKLQVNARGDLSGETDLFIKPGFQFQVVDRLMTNFHQPHSTLLALVFAFAGVENVKQAYSWAMERKFRLFSYGDLSVWKT